MNIYFPSEYWPIEYYPKEYWPILSVSPVVPDTCGCITIEDISYFDVTVMDEIV